jgi:hypothetical protein
MGFQASPGGPFTLETDRLVFQGQSLTTGGASKHGELARVVVSDLINDATPLLRYDIGDLAIMTEPAPYSAACYGSIEELRGKVTDTLCDGAGRRIVPFAILGCLKETLGLAQYRLICLERDLFVLQYRPARSAPIELDAALKGLSDIVGDSIKVIAQQVPAIQRETSGKLRPIINLSTIEGKGRDQLLRDLNLADLNTGESRSRVIESQVFVLKQFMNWGGPHWSTTPGNSGERGCAAKQARARGRVRRPPSKPRPRWNVPAPARWRR